MGSLTLKAKKGRAPEKGRDGESLTALMKKVKTLNDSELTELIESVSAVWGRGEQMGLESERFSEWIDKMDELITTMSDLPMGERSKSREGLPDGLMGAAQEGARGMMATLNREIDELDSKMTTLARTVKSFASKGSEENGVDEAPQSKAEPAREAQRTTGGGISLLEIMLVMGVMMTAVVGMIFTYPSVKEASEKNQEAHHRVNENIDENRRSTEEWVAPSSLARAMKIKESIQAVAENPEISETEIAETPSLKEVSGDKVNLTYFGLNKETCKVSVAKSIGMEDVGLEINDGKSFCGASLNKVKFSIQRK